MKISVITAAFNSEATIGYTVESFLAQSHPDREMIVIDGASCDRTVEIVRGFGSDLVRVVSEPDRGVYDAMNAGLQLFDGDAVGFLNSDDRYHDSEAISSIAEALESADVVHGDIIMVRSHDCKAVVRRWRATEYKKGSFRRGWMPAHPTFYMRREVVTKVGSFDTRLKTAADYDYMLRVLEVHGFAVARVNRVLVDMQYGGHSTRSMLAYIKGNLESLQSRRAWLDSRAVDLALIAKPLRKIKQWVS